MKKILNCAVSALMGLGLLVSVTACAGGDGSTTPSVPKAEAVAAASLEASGATTSIGSDDDLKNVFEALMEDPAFDFGELIPKKSIIANADMYGDDYGWESDEYPDWDDDDDYGSGSGKYGPFSEFVDKVGDFFMESLENFDNSGKSSASLNYSKEIDVSDYAGLYLECDPDVAKVNLNAALSASGKMSASGSDLKVKLSYSGTVSETAEVEYTPDEDLGSSVKKIKATSAGAVTLTGVSISGVVDGNTGATKSSSASGKVYVAASASAGASVCTEAGLGGKLLFTIEAITGVNLSDFADMMPSEGTEVKIDATEIMSGLEYSVKVSIAAYDDNGVETFKKTFKDIEELETYFGM